MRKRVAAVCVWAAWAAVCQAQPGVAASLQAAPANTVDAGPFGKIAVNGVVSGMGLWQGNPVSGDDNAHAALSNGQVFLQKTTGWWQFYVQAGAYNLPVVGAPFLSTEKAMTDLYGPVPVAYLKLAPSKDTSILIGALPGVTGAEYTFTFQNLNVSRGLLWNQENSVNRGIQVNQALGKVTASLTWNDGFYSNRYSWLGGSLTYTSGPHSVSFAAMGNLGHTEFQTLATPAQNNGSMYAFGYTYAKGKWIVQPYAQYTEVSASRTSGAGKGASTAGGAVLVNHTFQHGWSLAARAEYIASSGTAVERAVNLLYGPGSAGWSATVTPAFQHQRFFVRGDLSFVRASDVTPGYAFGAGGAARNQPRGIVEAGFLF